MEEINRTSFCKICSCVVYDNLANHESNHMIEILPHLYLGAIWNAHNMNELTYFNINKIINVGYEIYNKFHDAFQYKKFFWDDIEEFDISIDLDSVAQIIHEAVNSKKNVLVHCYMGRSRSPSAIIAYLIKHKGLTVDEALKLIQSKKSDVQPNKGFIQQLRSYNYPT
ncbi:MAG: hypothetical protein Hyperionvirus2_146 [Hyperionvirus sp.]|uniref:Dual specificity phosphatase n=1 Tax=Hyperionvirus sp. TaxID=2487770 RepID=A0A3G5A6H3_9VIRU|nr:MAG: hypothetical protein Hyperionvirus2_146 [Hyperionvirus sp.]